MDAIKKILKRYFVDAMGAMALGLFASLIIGLIIGQVGRIPGLGILRDIASYFDYDFSAVCNSFFQHFHFHRLLPNHRKLYNIAVKR